jgi:two-component system, cell cycle sensor histidine kinase and response regulator CckA
MALAQLRADQGWIEQMILNLVVNARDAMPQGGTLSIRTMNVDVSSLSHRRSEVRPGSYVVIEVADTGSGIDAESMLHLFEPFYPSKEVGKGTGLGLSTVYGIIKQSGGDVAVESHPAVGTTFRMYLPRRHEAADVSRQVPSPTELGGTEIILLVEDEAGVRQLVREMLRALGYTILEAASGEEAMRLFAENMDRIDLLLTDVIMPRMSGRQLTQHLRSARPQQKVLYMSGYPDDVLAEHRAPGESVFLLQKPFEPDALARKVREVLDAPAAFSAKS